MPHLTITIPGEMRGKGRPRFASRGKFVTAYTDSKTVSSENWIKSCAIDQVGQPVLEGPLAVGITVTVQIPASWSKKRRAAALCGIEMPTGKPDCDNCEKLIFDSLNKIVWRDDSVIVDASFSKRYAEIAETVITVTPL